MCLNQNKVIPWLGFQYILFNNKLFVSVEKWMRGKQDWNLKRVQLQVVFNKGSHEHVTACPQKPLLSIVSVNKGIRFKD